MGIYERDWRERERECGCTYERVKREDVGAYKELEIDRKRQWHISASERN